MKLLYAIIATIPELNPYKVANKECEIGPVIIEISLTLELNEPNASTIYNIGEYVADKEDTSIGLGDGKLYKCIQQTTAGIPLTNTTYFTLQTRTVIEVNRYLV